MINFFEKSGKTRADDMDASEDMVFDFFDFFDRTIDDFYVYVLNRLKDKTLAQETIISIYFSLMKRRRFFWWERMMNVSTLLLIADKQITSSAKGLTSMKKQVFDEASLESFLGTINEEKLSGEEKARIRTHLLEEYRKSQMSATKFVQATAGVTAIAACTLIVSSFAIAPMSVGSTSKKLAAAQILLTSSVSKSTDSDVLEAIYSRDFTKAKEIIPSSKKSFNSLVKELKDLEEMIGSDEDVVASNWKAFAADSGADKYDDKQEVFKKSVSILHKIREKAGDIKMEYVRMKIEYLQNRNHLISGIFGGSLINLEAGESALKSGSRKDISSFLADIKSTPLDSRFSKIESTFGRTSEKLSVKLRDGKKTELASAEVVLENNFVGKEMSQLRSTNIAEQKVVIKTLAKERRGNTSNVMKELSDEDFEERMQKFASSVDTASSEEDLVLALYDWYLLLEDIEDSYKDESGIFSIFMSDPLEDEKLLAASIGVLISERVIGYRDKFEELERYVEMAVYEAALDDARALSLDLASIAMEDQAQQKEMVNVILEQFGVLGLGD